jgi:hypothetical protein
MTIGGLDIKYFCLRYPTSILPGTISEKKFVGLKAFSLILDQSDHEFNLILDSSLSDIKNGNCLLTILQNS